MPIKIKPRSRALAHFVIPHPASRIPQGIYDDWETCDAEVVAALSARYRFSRANAVQLLGDGRIH